jgi:hypothetical protein
MQREMPMDKNVFVRAQFETRCACKSFRLAGLNHRIQTLIFEMPGIIERANHNIGPQGIPLSHSTNIARWSLRADTI